MRGQRRLAVAPQLARYGAFCRRNARCLGIIQEGQGLAHIVTIGPDLDTQHALPRCRQHLVQRQVLANAVRQPQTGQSRGGQDDGVILTGIQLAQAGVEVAPQRLDAKPRVPRLQLCSPAHAGGTHHRIGRKFIQRGIPGAHEGIARIGPRHHCRQVETFGQVHRHILERMHGQFGTPVEQRHLQFLGEQPLAADLGQRPVQDLVSAGGHAQQRDACGRMAGAQQLGHMVGLPECQSAFARGNAQGGGIGGFGHAARAPENDRMPGGIRAGSGIRPRQRNSRSLGARTHASRARKTRGRKNRPLRAARMETRAGRCRLKRVS